MADSGWDQGKVHVVEDVLKVEENPGSRDKMQEQFLSFIQDFRIDNDYIYRDKLRENLMAKQYVLDIDIDHLISYNEELAQKLSNTPAEMLPLFESAANESALKILSRPPSEDCQVTLHSSANLIQIRDLNAKYVGKLVRISGIVISASTLSSKATHLHIMCRVCRNVKLIPVAGGAFSGVTLPRTCEGQPDAPIKVNCPIDPFIVVHEKSKFVDQQILKLQEAPDMVPVGELPRHVMLSADRNLTNKVVPGIRVIVTGIYSIFQSKSASQRGAAAIRTPYIRVVGLQVDLDGAGRGRKLFTNEEEEEFIRMARTPNLYESFANSIAPSIFGTSDIKKAISCLLFGGSKKILPDGMRLRGDINVMLLGDPGVAKSQLLKFVEKVAPVAVYTSGKGSSAAGLTASVVRDPQTREFYLEGGAMVLADGGVCCIDEFDKMREEDRVAIHEAMEQQTISIAKAGIVTILNSRTSVLAAANPIFGRYDDMKSPGDNIDFQSTILSRFDMIFIVKDEHNEAQDMAIAKFVLGVHMNHQTTNVNIGEIPIETMRSYIRYCKAKCAPRLTREAAEKLSSHFVSIRREVKESERENQARSSIPITVRQLEAIVRISESLAKMTLSPVATDQHVDEAIRLFKFSTMNAAQTGSVEGMTREDLMTETRQIENSILKRISVGAQVPVRRIRDDYVAKGFSEAALHKALDMLTKREILSFENQRKTIRRLAF